VNSLRVNSKPNRILKSIKKLISNQKTKRKMVKRGKWNGNGTSAIRRPDPKGKKIKYEERRNRLQEVLEKRHSKSTDDPKDNPKKNPGTENSKK
jgi:hypothetical protein